MQALGALLASLLPPEGVVALAGDLGAGKTTFSQGVIRARAPQVSEVTSPTFTLVQPYDSPEGMLYHCDFYRLEDVSELDALGLEEMAETGLLLVEWPEIANDFLPEGRICCNFSYSPDGLGRQVQISADTLLLQRLEAAWRERI